jgi:hypothetical protein
METGTHRTHRLDHLLQAGLVLWLLVAMAFQFSLGLADNGDYLRSMSPFSRGPWLEASSQEAAAGQASPYNVYWIPYWELEWRLVVPRSSAALVWLPGVGANALLYSTELLFLPALSLGLRLAVLGVLLLFFRWSAGQGAERTMLLLGIGLPLVLLLGDTAYLGYFNTFYNEAAALVYLLLFLAALMRLQQRRTRPVLLAALACVFLLAAVRAGNLYWPLLALPFILSVWYRGQKVPFRRKLWLYAGLAALLVLPAALITRAGRIDANPYHSLFYGALTFSSDPSAHLQRLDLADAADCVGRPAYSPEGTRCRAQLAGRLTFLNTVRVLQAEPAVFVRMARHVLENMQDLSLDFLGLYAQGHPWAAASRMEDPAALEQRYWLAGRQPGVFGLWSALKFSLFPTGLPLLLILLLFAGWFIFELRRPGLRRSLALPGLLLTLACGVDMLVAVLGDGRYELIKHLFLANLLFDLALLAFLGGLLLAGRDWLARRSTPHQDVQ